jgi:hypothetical protein
VEDRFSPDCSFKTISLCFAEPGNGYWTIQMRGWAADQPRLWTFGSKYVHLQVRYITTCRYLTLFIVAKTRGFPGMQQTKSYFWLIIQDRWKTFFSSHLSQNSVNVSLLHKENPRVFTAVFVGFYLSYKNTTGSAILPSSILCCSIEWQIRF